MKKISKPYFAVGLNDSLEGKRIAGTLVVSDLGVTFQTQKEDIVLPLHGIHVHIGGSGNSLVFFSHSTMPEWSIYTSDKSILNDPAVKNNPVFADLTKARMSRNLSIAALVIAISLILTTIVYGIYWLRNSFSYAIASRIPISWEEQLGNTVYKTLTSGKKVYSEESTLNLLNPVVNPITEAAKDSGYTFKFHIIEDDSLNAFALPGGHVVIHSGLILKSETPEEIAGVLAHEISHVTEKHGVRQIISSIGIFVVVQTLFGDLTGLLAIITQNSGLLIRTKFSRDFEREADARGFNYLHTAKIDPNGMVRFFEKILEEEKKIFGETGNSLEFISTHPGTEERMEIMKQKISELPDKNFVKISMKLSKLQRLLKE